jgi:hypothetical protein
MLASATGLPAEFILAWAGFESGYGKGAAALLNNDFFGLTLPKESTTGGWSGAVACSEFTGQTKEGFACFPNNGSSTTGGTLLASALGAFGAQNGRYLDPALAAQAAGGVIAAIASAIAKAGFNSEPIDYGTSVATAGQAIRRRMDCPK